MPKGYWLATYKKIENSDNLKSYAAKATEALKSFGALPLIRGGKYICLEGENYKNFWCGTASSRRHIHLP